MVRRITLSLPPGNQPKRHHLHLFTRLVQGTRQIAVANLTRDSNLAGDSIARDMMISDLSEFWQVRLTECRRMPFRSLGPPRPS
jgi:hypothetical protein